MKKSIILEIFNGGKKNIDYMQRTKEINNDNPACDIFGEIKEKLSPELLELYEKHIDALSSDWLNEIDYHFVQGFKLGLRIGIECMEV